LDREYHKWFSPSLQREMEILMFGKAGIPVLVFPTLRGRFYEYEDKGMVALFEEQCNNGEVQVFCVDSIDGESWCNFDAPPIERPRRHITYEQYIIEEVLPFIKEKNISEELIVHGCDFGGYHSLNFTLRHPEYVTACISIGGNFDIRQYVYGFFDDSCYYNSPLDFLPNIQDEAILSQLRENVRFTFATGENDFALASNVQISRIMASKNIPHWLDIWRDGTGHDWQWWKKMVKKYFNEQ